MVLRHATTTKTKMSIGILSVYVLRTHEYCQYAQCMTRVNGIQSLFVLDACLAFAYAIIMSMVVCAELFSLFDLGWQVSEPVGCGRWDKNSMECLYSMLMVMTFVRPSRQTPDTCIHNLRSCNLVCVCMCVARHT